MSSIARELSVTVGTLTIAMNSTVKKAMWNEAGDSRIGGSYIFLFRSGRKRMGITPGSTGDDRDRISDLSEDEMQTLVKALMKLNQWFRSKDVAAVKEWM